jgi:hypothetical protein
MSSKPNPKSCFHTWTTYTGILHIFEYCEKCGIKQSDTDKLYKDKDWFAEEYPEAAAAEQREKEARDSKINAGFPVLW